MAQPYLIDLTAIVQRLALPGDIVCKHFFSGAAAYVDGRIFMSLTPAGLALKLPEDDCRTILAQGGKPLQYFPKSPVKKGYVVLPDSFTVDEHLSKWVARNVDIVKKKL